RFLLSSTKPHPSRLLGRLLRQRTQWSSSSAGDSPQLTRSPGRGPGDQILARWAAQALVCRLEKSRSPYRTLYTIGRRRCFLDRSTNMLSLVTSKVFMALEKQQLSSIESRKPDRNCGSGSGNHTHLKEFMRLLSVL